MSLIHLTLFLTQEEFQVDQRHEIIFKSISNQNLGLAKAFSNIKGIARGLLYIHQDSWLRIVCHDPKVSNFGLTRRVGGDETKANTNRDVGTVYMPADYVGDGLFLINLDVFNFGVVVLEIVARATDLKCYKQVMWSCYAYNNAQKTRQACRRLFEVNDVEVITPGISVHDSCFSNLKMHTNGMTDTTSIDLQFQVRGQQVKTITI
ncbi:hypothetical protein RJ640_006307 [Escallonia rubra]|uniref:Serine-threonine/tyrosine-protein kinase catalytic domain-containing protein n=1 Tax=Escallonia rubra TaxID=112253 RepID=A0AA88RPT9_9ASTE|nr:hypothetical protein RJ640_006307 [Escallonia rubra]